MQILLCIKNFDFCFQRNSNGVNIYCPFLTSFKVNKKSTFLLNIETWASLKDMMWLNFHLLIFGGIWLNSLNSIFCKVAKYEINKNNGLASIQTILLLKKFFRKSGEIKNTALSIHIISYWRVYCKWIKAFEKYIIWEYI